MAIDALARGMAANASGGGGGTDVNIDAGIGINITDDDTKVISNTGVVAVTNAEVSAENGTIKVATPGQPTQVSYVKPKGLDNAAYKDVDTSIDDETSEDLPTSQAVSEFVADKFAEFPGAKVYAATTAEWNAQTVLVSERNAIYVYTDYDTVDDEPVPSIKIGDGVTRVIDLTFLGTQGITSSDIEAWNAKVSTTTSGADDDTLVFF